MKLCPIAFITGCKKCPIFSVCPLKRFIGDQNRSIVIDSRKDKDIKK